MDGEKKQDFCFWIKTAGYWKAVEKSWSDELISYPRDMVLKNLDYLLDAGKLLVGKASKVERMKGFTKVAMGIYLVDY